MHWSLHELRYPGRWQIRVRNMQPVFYELVLYFDRSKRYTQRYALLIMTIAVIARIFVDWLYVFTRDLLTLKKLL